MYVVSTDTLWYLNIVNKINTSSESQVELRIKTYTPLSIIKSVSVLHYFYINNDFIVDGGFLSICM